MERKEKKAKVDENGTRLKKKNEKIFFGNKNKLSKNIRGCKIQNFVSENVKELIFKLNLQ